MYFQSAPPLSTTPPAVSEFPENAVCKPIKTVCPVIFALCGEFSIDQLPIGKKIAFTYVIIMPLYHRITEASQFF